MVDRRKSQNYQALPQYLTEEHWTSFEKQPRERSQFALLAHAWNLGLRCPSEGSFAVIFNLLQLTCRSDVHSSTSSFQKYQALQTLKKIWKNTKLGGGLRITSTLNTWKSCQRTLKIFLLSIICKPSNMMLLCNPASWLCSRHLNGFTYLF